MTTTIAPICVLCRHFHGYTPSGTGTCDAFPDAASAGIPRAIWACVADHRKPFAGDHGIQFSADSEEAADYADELFADA